MIKLYYLNNSSTSVKQCEDWLIDHNLNYEKKKTNCLTENELIYILSLTENGFTDILMDNDFRNDRSGKLSFSFMINTILNKPYLLKSPIIVDEKQVISGYNAYNMRALVPRNKRVMEISQYSSYVWGELA